MRDEFSARVKNALALRVGNQCSRPECGAPTAGPQIDPSKALNVGVAAHITAASERGPRFDPTLSPTARSSAPNGIWLCQNCAKLIDNDPARFPAAILREWKSRRERDAAEEVALGGQDRGRSRSARARILDVQVQEATLIASSPDSPDLVTWAVWVQAYLTPLVREEIDIPLQTLQISLDINSSGLTLRLADRTRLTPKGQHPEPQLARIFGTTSELTVRGAGRAELYASMATADERHRPDTSATQKIEASFRAVHATTEATFALELLRAEDAGGFTYGRWVYPASRVKERIPPPLIAVLPKPIEFPFEPLPRPEGW
jgi:hypothetical protein